MRNFRILAVRCYRQFIAGALASYLHRLFLLHNIESKPSSNKWHICRSRYLILQCQSKGQHRVKDDFCYLFSSANISQSYITTVHDRLKMHRSHLLGGYRFVTLIQIKHFFFFCWEGKGNQPLNIYKDMSFLSKPTCTEYMPNK